MRNTARSQVMALALFGALAWASLDVAYLRTAAADFLFPKQTEQSLPVPEFDVPALGQELDAQDRRPPQGSELDALKLLPVQGEWGNEEPRPRVVS